MKKNIINFVIIITITILVLYISLKDNFIEIINSISNMNLYLFLLAIIIYIGYLFGKSIVMQIIVKNFKEDYTLKKSFRMGIETNFFHAITPFSTGGQPYEIYRLSKDGVNVIHSANISVQNFIIYQTALVILGTIALLYNQYMHLFESNLVLKNLVALGFVINFLVIVILFMVTLLKKMNKVVINFCINILYKLKLIKNKEEKQQKFEQYLYDFNTGAKILLKNKWKFLLLILIELVSLILLYLVPYFLIKGIEMNIEISLIKIIVSSAYVMIIGSFVPIPGGTGGLEYGFIAFFGNLITGPILNASMLLWRFITYYFGMILGAVVLGLRKKE